MRVDPQGEAGVTVSEVLTQGLDVLAAVQQNRCVEVPESVHAVFPGTFMASPLGRLRDHGSCYKSGLPGIDVEVGTAHWTTTITREEQQLRERYSAWCAPRQGDLDQRERAHVDSQCVRYTFRERHVAFLFPFRRSEYEVAIDDLYLTGHM